MATKFTAGPWHVEIDGTFSGVWPNIFADGMSRGEDDEIARLNTAYVAKKSHQVIDFHDDPKAWKKTRDHAEIMANARLIAAAPELYEALERTLSWLTSYPGGGTMGPEGPYEQARAALAKATQS